MTATLVRAAALMGIYLLVLTSLAPGDIAVGTLLGLAVAVTARRQASRPDTLPSPAILRGVGAVVLQTVLEVVRGSWRTARFCLGAPGRPGFVEIARGDRSRVEVALWGVLTGEAPDEIVVDVDDERDVLVVHLLDAGDPAGVRERHRRNHERLRRGRER